MLLCSKEAKVKKYRQPAPHYSKPRTSSLFGRFHTNFTPVSHRLHTIFISLPQKEGNQPSQTKEGIFMTFLGLEWYWWLVITAVLAVSIPFKIKFMKWWSLREQEKKKRQHGKWGDDE